MRVLAFIANGILFIFVAYLMIEDWPPRLEQQLALSAFFITPALSIAALWISKGKQSDSWISLFFERKRLEEKQKLSDLKSESQKD